MGKTKQYSLVDVYRCVKTIKEVKVLGYLCVSKGKECNPQGTIEGILFNFINLGGYTDISYIIH